MRNHSTILAALSASLILVPSLLLAGCTQGSVEQRITFASSLVSEASVRVRCPRTALELGVLVGIRIAVDVALQGSLTEDESRQLKEARTLTDSVCGITTTPPPAPAEEAPPAEVPATPQI